MIEEYSRNSALVWLPPLQQAGLPMPRTVIVHVEPSFYYTMSSMPELDAIPSDIPVSEVQRAVREIGTPSFIRSDIMSAKHSGPDACRIESDSKMDVMRVLYQIAEAHAMAFIVPDPRAVLVREWITMPNTAFHENKNMGEEYRVFVEDGEIVCEHPYWPQAPELYGENVPSGATAIARDAGKVLEGAWSIDIAMTADGPMLIDCATAGESFHWPGCENEKRWRESWMDVPEPDPMDPSELLVSVEDETP